MNITVVLMICLGVAGVAVAGEGYLLKQSYEKQGALQTALDTATLRLKETNDALRAMDKIHQTNNAKSDDSLFDGLLPPGMQPKAPNR